jgi:DNA-binding beta-propeller fold protein YncE
VDTVAGKTKATFEMRSPSVCSLSAIAPDGLTLYLTQGGEGATRFRIFDVPTATLLPIAEATVSTLTQNSYRTPGVFSPDGRWMYSFDSGSPSTNCTSTDGPRCVSNATAPSLIALDLVSRRVVRVGVPMDQTSSDFEKYLLWSIGVAPSGDKVYAINPALGVVDEIDARALALRRTAKMTVSRSDADALAAVVRFFFPVADAKRYVTSGAVFSPDGQRIYAVAEKGLAVIDAVTLSSQAWQSDNREFDGLALTADGQRLYAVSNTNGIMSIIAASDGARLGELRVPGYGEAILRIDSGR